MAVIRLKKRQPRAAQRRFCRRATLYHSHQPLESCDQHESVFLDLLEVQQLEHLNALHQVSVDEGGDLLGDPYVARKLDVSIVAIEVAREQLARDIEIAGSALVLEPPDEGPEPAIVVDDNFVLAR